MNEITETVINKEMNKFVICRAFRKSYGIITTFSRKDNNYLSNFNLNENRIHRIQRIIDSVPGICSLDKNEKEYKFDCIESIYNNTDIFDSLYIPQGLIHFDSLCQEISVEEDEEIPTRIYEINPRLIIKNYPESENHTHDIKLKFGELSTDKIKIFTIVMIRGFILCILDKSTARIYMTISNPNKNIIGLLSDTSQMKMVGNIKLIWPIIKTEKNEKTIVLRLDSEQVLSKLPDLKYPILIKITRKLDEDDCKLQIVGESIYIK